MFCLSAGLLNGQREKLEIKGNRYKFEIRLVRIKINKIK